MLSRLEQNPRLLSEKDLGRASHVLLILPKAVTLEACGDVPALDALRALLGRRRRKPAELVKTPLGGDLPQGGLVAWMMLDTGQSVFAQQTAVRKTLQLLLAENPEAITIGVFGDAAQRRIAAERAVYAAWVNGAMLPSRKSKPEGGALKRITVQGYRAADGFAAARAQALGNTLCRTLTVLPPNELTPAAYRDRIRKLAREQGWEHEEFGLKRLRKMGAGAFVAVAQGSPEADAAIVHLRYRPQRAVKAVALVGKGICFDTGGHNLKPARYMHGMHEDMNGSAVALGTLLAATQARLPVQLDCWLAIAENHLSPAAYRQNEVVTALNGTTIEIVHTDAEGRMVLADTLTLAARGKPDLMIDFATLTGSMHVALGDRYSGIFASSEDLARRAIAAGATSGERVCAFPMDEDYDAALDSTVADVKQCTLEGGGDHILAARLLGRFTDSRPWIHMDLSASSCKGGLGAVGSEVTGFGVGWSMALLQGLAAR